jgi:hypothetical protein
MTRQSKGHGKDQDKTTKAPHKPAGREARLAAALRENLRRRKAQERGRTAPEGADAPPDPAQAPGDGRVR